MESVENGIGLEIILWIQSIRTPFMEAFFSPFDSMGSTLFYLAVLPLLYWCVDARLGRYANLLFLVSAWTNGWLKDLWARPRPPQVSPLVQPGVEVGGFGLPSGHTMMATTLWGTVAAWSRRPVVVAILVVYIVLMGLSRLVEGVHFPQDVLVGWLLGSIFVAGSIWILPRLASWLLELTLRSQIGLAALTAGIMILVFPLLCPARGDDHYQYAVAAAASFFGSAAGFALELRLVRFSAKGAAWQRIVRFVAGFATVMLISFGLKSMASLIAPEPGLVEGILRFTRYAIVGFFLAFGAPWLFVRIGLATESDALHEGERLST